MPFASTRMRSGTWAGSSRRRTTSSATTCIGRCSSAIPATRSAWTCPRRCPREDPDERYRRAARTLSAWRSDGTLHKDSRPSIYVYEQVYRVPGTDHERTQRGFFARLRIEPFGPESRVLPHERTLSGPKEDRYRLLRATSLNTSPVVGLFRDPDGGRPASWPGSSRGRRRST